MITPAYESFVNDICVDAAMEESKIYGLVTFIKHMHEETKELIKKMVLIPKCAQISNIRSFLVKSE